MPSRLQHPYLLLALTTLFWAGNWVVGRGFRHDVPPIALAFWRWAVALACVAPLALPHLRGQWLVLRRHWPMLTLLGVLGVGLYNTLIYVGLQYTTATNGVLLNSFIPIVIIAISWAWLGKSLGRTEGLGVLISLAGVLIIVSRGEPASLLALTFNVGDLWVLVSVVVWAVYTVCLQWRPADLHPYVLLAVLCGIGLLTMAPVYAWEIAQGRSIHPTPAAIGGILYTGIFPAFVGYIFWNRAVAEVGSNRAGLFIHLMPVFATILSALFLGEKPMAFHFAGIALILGGIWLTTFPGRRAAP